MSLDRCLELARGMGVPDRRARELCADRSLQRCATALLPRPGDGRNLDAYFENLSHCYGEQRRAVTPEGRS